MASDISRQVAARCWCRGEAVTSTMDVDVAEEFAKVLDLYTCLLEEAWGIIANSGEGNWSGESVEWINSAQKFRQKYHKVIAGELDLEYK